MLDRRTPSLLLALLLVTTACVSTQDPLTNQVLEELINSKLSTLMWAAAWRSVLFGMLGLGLGIGLFQLLRARALLRLDWKHAKWVRGLAGVLIVIGAMGTGAWWGFWTGSLRGAEAMIRDGQIGTEMLPIAGDAGSMLIASVYVGSELAERDPVIDENELAARVVSYAKGEWSMPLEQLHARLADVRTQTVGISVALARRELFAKYPELEGTLADKLVPWVLDKLSAKLTEKVVETTADSETAAMLLGPASDVLTTLDDAAARDGDDELLSHAELREHVVEVGLQPMLMRPLESFAKGQRNTGLLAFVLLLLLVVGGVRLADYLIARRAASTTAARSGR